MGKREEDDRDGREKMERETGVGERNSDWRKRERQGWETERGRKREKEERETGMGERTREKIERVIKIRRKTGVEEREREIKREKDEKR